MNPDLINDTAQQQSRLQDMNNMKVFEAEDPNCSGAEDDSDTEKPARRSGRRKIKIEYIEDKNRRHITFSKRKAGIMKKAYELSTLTGTQVLLLVVSETGLVYTFTTVKLQPIVTKPEGKNLIQACLNAPDPMSLEQSGDASYTSPRVDKKEIIYEDKKVEAPVPPTQQQAPSQSQVPQTTSSYGANYSSQQPAYNQPGTGYNNHPGYMPGNGQPYQSPQQQSQQAYSQMSQPQGFYGNQQHNSNYLPHQQQPQGFWQQQQAGLPRQDQSPTMDDKARRGVKK